jgi:hypothetical protein
MAGNAKNRKNNKSARQAKSGGRASQPMVQNSQGKRKKRTKRANGRQNGVPRASVPGTGSLGLGGGSSGSTNRRRQVIEEDEYIGEINGSVGFVTTQYPINPGQVGTFPWGSRIFALYEEYDFTFLEFYYKREVSEYAANGQTGKVMLSIDYDASDVAPTTKQQVEDTQAHVDFMPCTPFAKLAADVALMRKNPGKYVRLGAQPANTDIKTFDSGNLWVSTYGCASTAVVGELHVRYRCVAKEPILEPASLAGGAVHFSGLTPTTANNFATAALQSGGTVAMQGITLGVNTIVIPAGIPGNYLVAMSVAGSTSATAPSLSSQGTSTLLNLFTGTGTRDSTYAANSAAGTANVPAMLTLAVTVPTGGSTLTLTPSTLVGGESMDLFIISLPSTVLTGPKRDSERETAMAVRLAKLEQRLASLLEYETERFIVPDIEDCAVQSASSSAPPLRRRVLVAIEPSSK